jgi:hypothetical protein
MIFAWSRSWHQNPDLLLREVRELGVTDVFLLLTDYDGAYYRSSLWTKRDLSLEIKRLTSALAEEGVRVHAWITPMRTTRAEKRLYMVNRLGQSIYDDPPYIETYKFLCPNRAETLSIAESLLREAAGLAEFYGVHLGYLQYPELPLEKPLAEGLYVRYDPKYDYCYCEACRAKFKAETERELFDEPKDVALRWRAKALVGFASALAQRARRLGFKAVSAHVHPGPQYAHTAAGQTWWEWGLDFYVVTAYRSNWGGDLGWVKRVALESAQLGRVAIGVRIAELSPGEAAQLSEVRGRVLGISLFQLPYGGIPQWLIRDLSTWA